MLSPFSLRENQGDSCLRYFPKLQFSRRLRILLLRYCLGNSFSFYSSRLLPLRIIKDPSGILEGCLQYDPKSKKGDCNDIIEALPGYYVPHNTPKTRRCTVTAITMTLRIAPCRPSWIPADLVLSKLQNSKNFLGFVSTELQFTEWIGKISTMHLSCIEKEASFLFVHTLN